MQASPGLLYVSAPSKIIEKVIKEFLINDENDNKLPKIKKFIKQKTDTPEYIDLPSEDDEECPIILVNDLVGKRFYSIGSLHSINSNTVDEYGMASQLVSGVVAVCLDGTFGVSTLRDENSSLYGPTVNEVINPSLGISTVTSGKTFSVGIDTKGQMYTWGEGPNGQLGQGLVKTIISEPSNVSFPQSGVESVIVSVTSGDNFSIALDTVGKIYSWGENFNSQLGLYRKPPRQLNNSMSLAEDLVFAPRLVPIFFPQLTVKKVSCGESFSLALTNNGKLFSWGTGECGQLGTGRCTKKPIPSEVVVSLVKETSANISDIACGSGHSLALVTLTDNSTTIYGWGLNKCGQLGLGDTKTRLEPSTTDSLKLLHFQKLYASIHSSAAIDSKGCLYTWGSFENNRLMHTVVSEKKTSLKLNMNPIDHFIPIPKVVSADPLKGVIVNSFCFSKKSSAALVLSTVYKIFPVSGPKRTFSRLQLFGCGFWNSPQIIVRFTAKIYSIYNPPRSCTGTLTGEGIITCKPPKFAEVGVYIVSITMDGINFLPQTFEINIYKETVITNQSPEIIDIRKDDNIKSIKMTINAPLPPLPSEDGTVDVKMMIIEVKESKTHTTTTGHVGHKEPKEENKILLELLFKGRVETIQQSTTITKSVSTASSLVSEQDINNEIDETITTVEITESLAIVVDDLNSSLNGKSLKSLAPGTLYEMKCVVSMNQQDYCAISNDPLVSTLIHSFESTTIEPCCISSEELKKLIAQMNETIPSEEVTDANEEAIDMMKDNIRNAFEDKSRMKVRGKSFIPSHKWPKGMALEAVITVVNKSLSDIVVEESSTTHQNDQDGVVVSVHCDSTNILTFHLSAESLDEIIGRMGDETVLELAAKFIFKGKQGEVIILSDKPISYFFYKDQPITVSPTACRKSNNPLLVCLSAISSSGEEGFPFSSADVIVNVHILAGVDSSETIAVPVNKEDINMIPVQEEIVQDEVKENEVHQDVKEAIVDPVIFVNKKYKVQVQLQPLISYYSQFHSDETVLEELMSKSDSINISVSLDGKSIPNPDKWVSLLLYYDVAKYSINPPVAKGGAVSGATINLILDKYINLTLSSESGLCVARIRGAKEDGVVIDIKTASLSHQGDTSVVIFTVPEAAKIKELDPIVPAKGKEKMYYVDLSFDGGEVFDNATAALLQLK